MAATWKSEEREHKRINHRFMEGSYKGMRAELDEKLKKKIRLPKMWRGA